MANQARHEPTTKIGELRSEKAMPLEGNQVVGHEIDAPREQSLQALRVLGLDNALPDLSRAKQSAGRNNNSRRDVKRSRLDEVITFRPKKGILTEPRIMGLTAVTMFFFLLPFFTNQNAITSSSSPDVTSYLVALRDFWASILQRVIAR